MLDKVTPMLLSEKKNRTMKKIIIIQQLQKHLHPTLPLSHVLSILSQICDSLNQVKYVRNIIFMF